jgi:GTPase SAR1 family protein
VFSVVNPYSFENVYIKWVPELQHFCPDTPILLCGSKIDLRDDPETIQKMKDEKIKPITYEEGEFLAWSCGCIGYVENSSLVQKGLKETFDACIRSSGAWSSKRFELFKKERAKKSKMCKTQ